jgi:hypothetical protein
MPVRELLARTSSRELTEWIAFEKVTGPLDSRLRTDIAAGIVAATVHNAQGAKRKAKPSDFMPTWFKRRKSPAEIWQDVLKANSALGGLVRHRADDEEVTQ